MKHRHPTVWVLLGTRAGDNAQALELAHRLGGLTQTRQLAFSRLSGLPNWMLASGFHGLTSTARAQLVPPWPDIVIATGRRAAPASLAIKAASGNTLAVHIGRPRMALERFDLVLTTPQYGLPEASNVVRLTFPFAAAKPVAEETLAAFRTLWGHLPRPWIAGVIGAQKFPVRFGGQEVAGFAAALDRHAQRLGGSAILIDSPRSAAGAIAAIAARMTAPHWLWHRGESANPYQAALHLADQFAVTSDSVSMVAEMVQTAKPTLVYHLPVSPIAPRWPARQGLAAGLARRGLLSPPRDVGAFLGELSARGWTGDLASGEGPREGFVPGTEQANAVAQILSLWRGRATD